MFPEFIKIAYCILVPVLAVLYFVLAAKKKWVAVNALSVLNLVLIFHSVFLFRQLWAAYELIRSFGIRFGSVANDWQLLLPAIVLTVMPVFSLIAVFRRNWWYSGGLVILILYVFPPAGWNLAEIFMKQGAFFCLFCSAYALLWLLNLLPYQSSPRRCTRP